MHSASDYCYLNAFHFTMVILVFAHQQHLGSGPVVEHDSQGLLYTSIPARLCAEPSGSLRFRAVLPIRMESATPPVNEARSYSGMFDEQRVRRMHTWSLLPRQEVPLSLDSSLCVTVDVTRHRSSQVVPFVPTWPPIFYVLFKLMFKILHRPAIKDKKPCPALRSWVL